MRRHLRGVAVAGAVGIGLAAFLFAGHRAVAEMSSPSTQPQAAATFDLRAGATFAPSPTSTTSTSTSSATASAASTGTITSSSSAAPVKVAQRPVGAVVVTTSDTATATSTISPVSQAPVVATAAPTPIPTPQPVTYFSASGTGNSGLMKFSTPPNAYLVITFGPDTHSWDCQLYWGGGSQPTSSCLPGQHVYSADPHGDNAIQITDLDPGTGVQWSVTITDS